MSKKDFIRSLNPDDAFSVLLTILNQDPNLEDMIYEVAKQVLCDIASEDIMVDVYNTLDRLDVDELYRLSGKTRYGYVEPSEKAWEMFEDALWSYIDEMQTYQKRELISVAKKYCIGIIRGIQKFEKESYSDFSEWVEDAPGENIEKVFIEWKKGQPSEKDITEVLEIIEKKGEL
jgi:hypothetical protein